MYLLLGHLLLLGHSWRLHGFHVEQCLHRVFENDDTVSSYWHRCVAVAKGDLKQRGSKPGSSAHVLDLLLSWQPDGFIGLTDTIQRGYEHGYVHAWQGSSGFVPVKPVVLGPVPRGPSGGEAVWWARFGAAERVPCKFSFLFGAGRAVCV